MSNQEHASNTDPDEPTDDSPDADFDVELRDHPALVRPDVEVGLAVELRGVHLSVVRDELTTVEVSLRVTGADDSTSN